MSAVSRVAFGEILFCCLSARKLMQFFIIYQIEKKKLFIHLTTFHLTGFCFEPPVYLNNFGNLRSTCNPGFC